MLEIMEGLSFAEYKKLDALSKHQLDDINISILYWQYRQTQEHVPSKSMLLGSAFHDLILLPETFATSWVVEPKVDLRTKAGKELRESFLADNQGKQFIDTETFATISAMEVTLNNHQFAKSLLKGTKREVSCLNTDNPWRFKCRADAICEDYILDIKTTSTKSIEEFRREIFKYRYHVQGACYLDHFSMFDKPFFLIAVQTVAPYDVVVYELSHETIQNGRTEYLSDIAKYNDWLNGGYSGLSNDVVKV